MAFRVFDKDGSGYVSSSELQVVMSRLGVEFSGDELEEMVNRSNIDTLVALISMSRRLFIHKKKFCLYAFFHLIRFEKFPQT